MEDILVNLGKQLKRIRQNQRVESEAGGPNERCEHRTDL